jgi:hypothetical protein
MSRVPLPVFGAAAQYYEADERVAQELDCVMNIIQLRTH